MEPESLAHEQNLNTIEGSAEHKLNAETSEPTQEAKQQTSENSNKDVTEQLEEDDIPTQEDLEELVIELDALDYELARFNHPDHS